MSKKKKSSSAAELKPISSEVDEEDFEAIELLFSKQHGIEQAWQELRMRAPFTETLTIPSDFPPLEVEAIDGNKQKVQITSIVLTFEHDVEGKDESTWEDKTPLIRVQVKNTGSRTCDPKFIQAVAQFISLHVGNNVLLRGRIFDSDSFHLYPADKDSACTIARHLLREHGHS
jgi:hypothetical protein